MRKYGAVVVTTLKKFSFVRVGRTSGLGRSFGRRASGLGRTSGAWAKIRHGMNS